MGITASGIVYPDSGDHTRLWEHFQTLAESVQDAIDDVLDEAPFATKAANETVTSSTALQDDDHLGLTLLPNTRYVLDGLLEYNGLTGAGLKYGFTLPAGASMRVAAHGYPPTDTSVIETVGSDGVNSVRPLGTFGTGTTVSAIVKGWILTGVAGGDLRFRWAQNVSNATPTTLLAGSFLRAVRAA